MPAQSSYHRCPILKLITPRTGGEHRIQITVDDLAGLVEKLKGQRFRSEIITGNGGKQILVEDPSGNLLELFEPFPTR